MSLLFMKFMSLPFMRLLVLVLYEYSPTRFACVRQTDPQKVYNGPRLPLRPATRLGLFGSGHFVRPRLRGARGPAVPPDQHDQRGGGAFFSVLGPRAGVLSRRGVRR